ncbi:MAG: tRNA preQ1(34) S-adenosylmethionine ribosyltransferase-isomerase QueA [Elusimicrobia bacterium]|nr:tRNA preQ1(34) S-adenosylmethionine ribosyltransferase-isomerase QueA [Elusimicrobiota bacterium]
MSDYDFAFPESLVADRPCEPRDAARLLVLDRATGAVEHAFFRDLPRFLSAGDCLVVNRSRVLHARLIGKKPTGGKAELLLVREVEPGLWSAIGSGVKAGSVVELPDGWNAFVARGQDGEWLCRFSGTDVRGYLERRGLPPLPPYILRRRRETGVSGPDAEDYQTVYAREQGSIAAPTAGLHFTPELLARLETQGVRRAELLLHVGPGTFRPVAAEDIREHRMLPEWYRLEEPAVSAMRGARSAGGRVVAVGTTAARSLETWGQTGRTEGESTLFITPGHEFRAFDAFITNFHLPRSTPLVLAAAFAGRERLLKAYREAIASGYRLYSYGDGMLIL